MDYKQSPVKRLSFEIYQSYKKYISGEEALSEVYSRLIDGSPLHPMLVQDFLHKIYTKEIIRMLLKVPYKDIEYEALKFTKSGSNFGLSKKVFAEPDKMIERDIIINIHSEIGEQALMAGSYLAEALTKKSYKGISSSGIELNNLSTDFEDTSAFDRLLKKDFLIVFSFNSLYATDHRKRWVGNLFQQARLNRVPVILTSKKRLEMAEYNVVNIRLSDKSKNEAQVIDEIFGKDK